MIQKHDSLELEMRESPDIIKRFLQYLMVVKAKSPLTVEEYYLDLRTFFRYMKQAYGVVPADIPFDEISIQDIDLDFVKKITLSDIYGFMNFCISDRENSAKTRARKTSTLRTYFKYLYVKEKLIPVNPIEELDSPKCGKSLPKYLTLDESLALLSAVDGKYRERDYCILTLFLNCGMRLSELCGINLRDLRSDSTLRIIGKGNKERIVYLNHACSAAIQDYLRVRPVDGVPQSDKDALFLSSRKKRISVKTVQYLVYQYLDKAGLGGRGLSVHKLRHTAATLMYQYGNVDIRTLKDLLGHENLGTTEIYTHLTNKQLEEASNANPLAEIGKKPKTDKE